MKTQRYLIATHTRDQRRNEPRNIGVILWTPHKIAARFLPADHAELIVSDIKMYERWTAFWYATCEKKEIDAGRGRTISRRKPEFLDELLNTQRGNYRLYDAGYVRERIKASDVAKVLETLYGDFVALPADMIPPEKLTMRENLASICRSLFASAGLANRPDFQWRGAKVPCRVGRTSREFPVDYKLGGGKVPLAVYKRVNLADERSIDATSFLFEKLIEDEKVDGRERCGTLFESSADAIPGAVGQLSEYSVTINVEDHDAERNIRRVAFGTAS